MGSIFDDEANTEYLNPGIAGAIENIDVDTDYYGDVDLNGGDEHGDLSERDDDDESLDFDEINAAGCIKDSRAWMDLIRGLNDEQGYINSEYDSDSDVLRSPRKDEGKSRRLSCREFNPETDYVQGQLTLQVGDIFPSATEFRQFLMEYGIQEGFEYTFQKNEKERIIAVCKKDCGWRVRASPNSSLGAFQVKILTEHQCLRELGITRANYKFLARKYLPRIKDDEKLTGKTMKKDAKSTYSVNVSMQKCRRAKRRCLEILTGSEADQYRRIRDYANIILHTNPGSTAGVNCDPNDEHRFTGFYCCLAACKNGFVEACRPIISIDGCHLKTTFGGVLLTAVGQDANNNMYPIAWAVVRIENKDNWKWFLERLLEDLGSVEDHGWNFISDQQKVISVRQNIYYF